MPEAVTLTLALPPELGDPQPILDELRRQVATEEGAVAAERMRTGAGINPVWIPPVWDPLLGRPYSRSAPARVW